jgi:hypothetical protein
MQGFTCSNALAAKDCTAGILKFESAFLLVFVHKLEVGVHKVLQPVWWRNSGQSRQVRSIRTRTLYSMGPFNAMVEELANWVRRY